MIAADGFDRRNGPIGSADKGGAWVPIGQASPVVLGHRFGTVSPTPGANGGAVLNARTGDAHVRVRWAKVTDGGVIFRYRDERNFWLASTAGLVKTVAGIATVAEQGLGQIPDGSILEVICTGPSISVLVNSVLVACVTDHDLAEDTRFGLASLAYSPSASTDYFSSFQVS